MIVSFLSGDNSLDLWPIFVYIKSNNANVFQKTIYLYVTHPATLNRFQGLSQSWILFSINNVTLISLYQGQQHFLQIFTMARHCITTYRGRCGSREDRHFCKFKRGNYYPLVRLLKTNRVVLCSMQNQGPRHQLTCKFHQKST